MKKKLILFCMAIHALHASTHSQDNNLFCQDVLKNYSSSIINQMYTIGLKDLGSMDCKKQMEFATLLYKNDSVLARLITNKESDLKILQTKKEFEQKIKKLFVLDKTIGYQKKLENDAYFNEQILRINKIKALPKDSYEAILKKNEELLLLMPNSAPKDRFELAFMQTISDTVYYSKLYAYQIFNTAAPILAQEKNELKKYRVSKEASLDIYKIMQEKSNKLALITLSNFKQGRKGDSIISNTVNYYDSLKEVILMKEGAFVTSSQIQSAIRLRKKLNLRPTQTDSLIERGMHLNQLKDSVWNKNPLQSYDAKDYENFWLSTILEPDQHSALLNIKYWPDAEKNAENDWKDLEKRGLIKDLDKKNTLIQLTNYYASLKAASNMYANNLENQAVYIRSVKENMPTALKLLQQARKNNFFNN